MAPRIWKPVLRDKEATGDQNIKEDMKKSIEATLATPREILSHKWIGEDGESYKSEPSYYSKEVWTCIRKRLDGSTKSFDIQLDKSSGFVWWGGGSYYFDPKLTSKEGSITWQPAYARKRSFVWTLKSSSRGTEKTAKAEPTLQKNTAKDPSLAQRPLLPSHHDTRLQQGLDLLSLAEIVSHKWIGEKGESYTMEPSHCTKGSWACIRKRSDGSSKSFELQVDKTSGFIWWGSYYCDPKETREGNSISWYFARYVARGSKAAPQGVAFTWNRHVEKAERCKADLQEIYKDSKPTQNIEVSGRCLEGTASIDECLSLISSCEDDSKQLAARIIPSIKQIPPVEPPPGLELPPGLEVSSEKLQSGILQELPQSLEIHAQKLQCKCEEDDMSKSGCSTKDEDSEGGTPEDELLIKTAFTAKQMLFSSSADDVETESGLDGKWHDKCGEVGTIKGDYLHWAHPVDNMVSTQIRFPLIDNPACIQMQVLGNKMVGAVDESSIKITWDDGNVWHKSVYI